MLSRLRSRLQQRLAGRVWPVFATGLRAAAEAGWITVLYAAVSVLADKRPPVIGPIEMSAFVGVGVVIGHLGRRVPGMGAVVLICAIILGGAIGALAGQAPDALAVDWQRALGLSFAGWLAGLGVLRGAAASIGEKSAAQLELMLRVVPLALGVLWAYGTYAARPELWQPFWITAMWGTAMYLSGSLLAIGMSRLHVLHAEVTDVRQRRAWRWLVFAVGFTILPATVPLAVLAGVPVADILAPILAPIQWLLGLVAYPMAFIIWILSILLRPVAEPLANLMDELAQRTARVPETATQSSEVATVLAFLITAVTLILIGLAVYFVARWLLTRRQPPTDDLGASYSDIERSIVLPPAEAPRATRRRRRLGAPRDAVSAYVAAMAQLDAHPELARGPSETPAAHAHRLRPQTGARGLDIARLAAAYQLARYGARSITRLENVRAVKRFQRIRQSLRRRPV